MSGGSGGNLPAEEIADQHFPSARSSLLIREGDLSPPLPTFFLALGGMRELGKNPSENALGIFFPLSLLYCSTYTDDFSLSVSAATPPQNPAPPPPGAQKLDSLGGLFFIPWPVPLFLRPPFRYCLAAAAASVQEPCPHHISGGKTGRRRRREFIAGGR